MKSNSIKDKLPSLAVQVAAAAAVGGPGISLTKHRAAAAAVLQNLTKPFRFNVCLIL